MPLITDVIIENTILAIGSCLEHIKGMENYFKGIELQEFKKLHSNLVDIKTKITERYKEFCQANKNVGLDISGLERNQSYPENHAEVYSCVSREEIRNKLYNVLTQLAVCCCKENTEFLDIVRESMHYTLNILGMLDGNSRRFLDVSNEIYGSPEMFGIDDVEMQNASEGHSNDEFWGEEWQ